MTVNGRSSIILKYQKFQTDIFPLSTSHLKQFSLVILLTCGACSGDRGAEPAEQQPVAAVEPGTATIAVNDSPEFTGRKTCQSCHDPEYQLFQGSHHDLAMQHATAESVQGDFEDTSYTYNEVTSLFYRDDSKFMVTTDNADGVPEAFEIKYTFGVYPLQQYLVELPGGRLQALSIAWDTRSIDAGGQRWFHLYPDEDVNHTDVLHWTGNNQNWNYMCAECHSTGYEKNYSAAENTYASTWSEIDVSCEACHGPGSVHIDLASRLPAEEIQKIPASGFPIDLSIDLSRTWTINAGNTIATLSQGTPVHLQEHVCARCHSRRTTIDSRQQHSKDLFDTHDIAVLERGLYHADGQVNDEVYVYGSFIQSRMHAAGVTCIDCHNPHSTRTHSEGNGLCLQCHSSDTYDNPEHHMHAPGTEAAQCVTCHMPGKEFMVVDTRHDHSFRVPRPDLTLKHGTPNVCNGCHEDRSAAWSLEKIGSKDPAFHFADAFSAAWNNDSEAVDLLTRVIGDPVQPQIIRATALELMGQYVDTSTLPLVVENLRADSPMVRAASVSALRSLAPLDRLALGSGSLADQTRLVRITAARLLAGFYPENLPRRERRLLDAAIQEYIAVQNINNDRAYAHVNLGDVYVDMRKYANAETSYNQAIVLDPRFLPAYTNLADLYRLLNRDQNTVATLERGLDVNPQAAALHHAMGLAWVRLDQLDMAIDQLHTAVELEPNTLRYTLVYAVALNSTGAAAEAIDILTSAYEQNQNNRDLNYTLATIHRDQGNTELALRYAEHLVEITGDSDQQARQLLDSLIQD